MSIPFVQPGSFIHNYMEWMKEQETPEVYDFTCACWCLSIAMGRHCVVSRPRAPVHLNMYCILVSESGIMRKSTSIRQATALVRRFFANTTSPMLLVENRATRGVLDSELARVTKEVGSAQLVLVASELASMLGRGTHVSGVPALLTDLYDCPDHRAGGGSLSAGSATLRNVYCSFLGGSTPSWLGSAITPEIIAGGFTSRCYFIEGRQRKRLVPWPSDHDDTERANQLTTQLEELEHESRTHSGIGISRGALDSFSSWYKARAIHKDTYRESFESREDAHVLRFAGLFAANECCWQINDDHIRRAIGFVAEIKRYGTQLFTGATVERTDLRLASRIRDELLAAGSAGIGRSDLYRHLGLSGRSGMEMRTLLSTMHDLDLVKVYEVATAGRTKKVYVATEYLKNELFLEDIARKLGLE